MAMGKRFGLATVKNMLSGVLLSPGPVSTHLSVKGLSPTFNLGVNKAKFMAAANQLVAANLGSLVILENISRSAHVFVKKTPEEVVGRLQDFATEQEYAQRFELAPASTITLKMQEELIKLGYVPAEHFKQQQMKSYRFVPMPEQSAPVPEKMEPESPRE